MVFVVGRELEVPVNIPHALQIALLHDLAELQTDDIDALDVINGEVTTEEKKENEAVAMKQILQGISFGRDIMELWQEYEDQNTDEAKFVKALDKIEAFLHLDEEGTGAYIPEQFHGDYADEAVKKFDEAIHHFPPLQKLLDPIKQDLQKKFEELGVEWVETKTV